MEIRLLILALLCIQDTCCQEQMEFYRPIGSDACLTFHINSTIQQVRQGYFGLKNPRSLGYACYNRCNLKTAYTAEYATRLNCTLSSAGDRFTFCLTRITAADSGFYTLYLYGIALNGTLYVMDKPEIPNVSPRVALVGSTMWISCAAFSTSLPKGQPFSYTWTVNGSVPSDPRYSISNNQLRIKNITMEDKYNMIQCSATEERGLSSMVEDHVRVFNKPVARISVSANSGIVGREMSFTCESDEGSADYTVDLIQWDLYSGRTRIRLPNCEPVKSCYSAPVPGYVYTCKRNSFILKIPAHKVIRNLNNTWLLCTLYYEDYSLSSQGVHALQVFDLYLATITSFTFLPSRVIMEYTPVNLTCTFDSDGNTTVKWIRQNGLGERNMLQHMRRTTSTLTIQSASCLDSGNYTCTVLNRDGSTVSRTAELKVNCQPRVEGCNQSSKKLYFGTKEPLNLTATVIANPKPTVDIWMESDSMENVSMTKHFDIRTNKVGSNVSVTVTGNKTGEPGREGYWITFTNTYGRDICFYELYRNPDAQNDEGAFSQVPVVIGILSGVVFSVVALAAFVILLRKRKICKRRESANASVTGMIKAIKESASKDNPAFSSYENLNVSRTTDGVEDHSYEGVDQKVYENAL